MLLNHHLPYVNYCVHLLKNKNKKHPYSLDSQSGFTLLEVLLAMALAALVMLLLAGSTHLVLKDWERSSNLLEDRLDMSMILLQIERALTAAYSHVYYDTKENKKYLFFEGEKDKVAWVSTVSPGRQAGLTAWELSNGDPDGLDIRIIPAFASDPTDNLKDIKKPLHVFEGYQAEFEYLYIDELIEKDSKWIEKWSARRQQGLPNAVRMTLKKEDNDGNNALEIIAWIMVYEDESMRRIKP